MRRAAFAVFLGALLAPAALLADVDLTGKWLTTSSYLQSTCSDFVQVGTALTATSCDIPEPAFSGTIDPMLGTFSITQPPNCPSGYYAAIDATASPDGNAFSGIVTLTFYHCTFVGCACITLNDGVSGTRETCGDGYHNLVTEQCDDGNTTNGDCCSSTCTFEDGLVCDDGDVTTVDDQCAGGTCRGTPLPETDFRVNTYTTAVQFWPVVACNGAGRFVISWDGFPQDGDGGAVQAQRYGSDGAPLGPEFRVNSYTTGGQGGTRAAMDAAGNFVIVWESFGQDGPDSGIFARRYDSGGTPAGTEFQVNTYTTDFQGGADVAAQPNGDFVVVWNSQQLSPNVAQDGSESGIFARRFSSAGVPQSGELQVNSYTTGFQLSAAVAIDAAGGFTVVWQSQGQDGDQEGVFGQRFTTSGTPLGSEFQVNTFTTGAQLDAVVAIDAAGGSVVAWSSDGQDGNGVGIFMRRYDASGAPVGTELQVNAYTTGAQRRPRISTDPTGAVIVWDSESQDGSSFGIFAKRYDPTWNPIGTEFQVNSYSSSYQAHPDVCSDATGDFIVIWSGVGAGDSEGIFAKRYEFADPFTLDHYKCYAGTDLQNPVFTGGTVDTVDQMTNDPVVVRRLKYICAPVDKNGEGIADPAQHLACYQVSGDRLEPRPSVEVSTQFQSSRFELKRPQLLCAPATKTLLP